MRNFQNYKQLIYQATNDRNKLFSMGRRCFCTRSNTKHGTFAKGLLSCTVECSKEALIGQRKEQYSIELRSELNDDENIIIEFKYCNLHEN